MLFQDIFYILSYILSQIPTLIFLGFDIAILVFATYIYKRNSFKYGLYLMISSIISIISIIIKISINYNNLLSFLEEEIGFSNAIIIYSILGWMFLGLEIARFVFLFLSVFYIYKTHQKDRIE